MLWEFYFKKAAETLPICPCGRSLALRGLLRRDLFSSSPHQPSIYLLNLLDPGLGRSGEMSCDDENHHKIKAAPEKPLWSRLDPDDPNLELAVVRPEEVDRVADFLLSYFFAQEPLGQCLGLDPDREVRPWLAKVLLHQIREGLSIAARNKATGTINSPFLLVLKRPRRMLFIKIIRNEAAMSQNRRSVSGSIDPALEAIKLGSAKMILLPLMSRLNVSTFNRH